MLEVPKILKVEVLTIDLYIITHHFFLQQFMQSGYFKYFRLVPL